jgi:basic amino acid/polyamine antiporter, APA family
MATTLTPPPAVAPPAQAEPSAAEQRAHALGLPSATALVIGSIICTGVFTMPAVMAGAGPSSIITLVVIGAGALLLGIMFGQLTKWIPTSGAVREIDQWTPVVDVTIERGGRP